MEHLKKDPSQWTKPGEYNMPRETAQTYARRGARRQKGSSMFCIEGEQVTVAQISARIGVGIRTTRQRLNDAALLDGPVTWSRLEKQP